MVGISPNLVILWCVQVSIKTEPPNPDFWEPGIKFGFQSRRKCLVIYSEKHYYSKQALRKNSTGAMLLLRAPRMSRKHLLRAALKVPFTLKAFLSSEPRDANTFAGFCLGIYPGEVYLRAESSQCLMDHNVDNPRAGPWQYIMLI